VFIGKVAEFPSLGAHGDTPEAALREIMFVVSEVVKDLARGGDEIPEPFSKRTYSGKLNLRMPPQMHRELAMEAAREHVSLNQLINLKLGGD
jgi:predicted HicB family RNase H-like nuclease